VFRWAAPALLTLGDQVALYYNLSILAVMGNISVVCIADCFAVVLGSTVTLKGERESYRTYLTGSHCSSLARALDITTNEKGERRDRRYISMVI
jgi:hypothetical protein